MYQKKVLPSGLRVITSPMPQVDSVTVLVLVEAGSRYETAANNGVSHFLEHMTFKGTKNRPNRLALVGLIDSIGGNYNAYTAKENTGFYIKAPSRHLELALDVLSDTLLNSIFDPAEIAKEKGVIIEEINMYEDEPASRVWEVLEGLLYPGESLGMLVSGGKKTVAGMTREQIVEYAQRMYRTGSVVVGLAGNISNEIKDIPLRQGSAGQAGFKIKGKNLEEGIKKAEQLVGKYFAQLPRGDGQQFVGSTAKQTKPESAIYFKKTDQAHLVLACRAYALTHPDRYVAGVMATLLGGYMSSRLFIEIRDRRGLAYYVGATKEEYSDVGYFSVFGGVRVADAEEAIKVMLEELVRLKEGKVAAEELIRAKENWKGRMELGLEDSYRVANFYTSQELFEKKVKTPQEILDAVDKVIAEDIQRVAKDIFVDQKLNLAMVGPFRNEEKFNELLKV